MTAERRCQKYYVDETSSTKSVKSKHHVMYLSGKIEGEEVDKLFEQRQWGAEKREETATKFSTLIVTASNWKCHRQKQ
jgi:hypothetical protein